MSKHQWQWMIAVSVAHHQFAGFGSGGRSERR